VEAFDPESGFTFRSYAHWWIRAAIGRAIRVPARSVGVPAHVRRQYNKLDPPRRTTASRLHDEREERAAARRRHPCQPVADRHLRSA
jgi:DNA-directed RNA polymerase sigma subunit (sigma70/sigma32)